MSRRKEFLLAVVTTALALAVCLTLAEVVLRFLPVASGLRTLAVTPERPVFRLTPNRAYVYSRDWDMAMANAGRVNNAGFVNDQDYTKDADQPLLAVIGDSYIEALMVPYAETLQGRLAKALEGRLRVYSFAASGAPLSQYLIWARHAARDYGAKALIVNVVGNDFDESHIGFRIAEGFWLYAPQPDGQLRLSLVEYRPGLLRRAVAYSALARYLAFNVNVKQAKDELETWWRRLMAPPASAPAQGSIPTPVYAGNTAAAADDMRIKASLAVIDAFFRDLPEMTGLAPDHIAFTLDGFRYPETEAAGAGTYFDRMRRAFIAKAEALGYETIDLDPPFQAHYRQYRQRFEWPRDGHWNGTAHGIAAEAVLKSRLLESLKR